MKIVFTLITLLLSTVAVLAQNSIDELLETCKSVGSSKFSSIVERDPNTREVVKVVKMFDSDTLSAKDFIKAFTKESSNATSVNQTVTGDEICHTLVFETDKQVRIYTLKYENDHIYHGFHASVIIKFIKKI